MGMVFGLDLHRRQITFDGVDTGSGEEWRGRIWAPDRQRFRRWLTSDVAKRANGGEVALAVEGCTGWRYVVEECPPAPALDGLRTLTQPRSHQGDTRSRLLSPTTPVSSST